MNLRVSLKTRVRVEGKEAAATLGAVTKRTDRGGER